MPDEKIVVFFDNHLGHMDMHVGRIKSETEKSIMLGKNTASRARLSKDFKKLEDENRMKAIDPVALEKAVIFGITKKEPSKMSKREETTGNSDSENYCYYYLHTNGDLIHKPKIVQPVADFEESPFVRVYWKVDMDDRMDAYLMLIRARMLGARETRIQELLAKWNVTDDDALTFIERIGLVCKMDGDQWCVHGPDFRTLAEDIAGFGRTIFEAAFEFFKQSVEAPS